LKSPHENIGYTELYVPFLENIDISESQNANLASFDLIGRAGNLFAYTGAKSRNFKIKFNITLTHVVEELYSAGINNIFQFGFSTGLNTKDRRKQAFFKNNLTHLQGGRSMYVDNAAKSNNYFDNIYQQDADPPTMNEGRKKALNLMIYWMNIVRTSTLNHSRDVKLGPPIIRINHGTMYNNIPCVCDDFSIKVDSKTPYDINTLTPFVVEINMNLHEVRAGNFGEYVPYDEIKGDNITGWDGLLNYGTMDPYNGVVGDSTLTADRTKPKSRYPITGPTGGRGGSFGVDLRNGVSR
jgi:hypothetical protein